MKSRLFLLLILISYAAHGQEDYVITTQGDTITGSIQILLPSIDHEEITIEYNDQQRRLKAFQFIEMSKDGEIYNSVKHRDVFKIMKLQTLGYLRLYTYRAEGRYEFGAKYLLKKTGEGIEIPSFFFKDVMYKYLEDCPTISEQIKDKMYKKSDLDLIIENYNQCIIRQTAVYSGDKVSKQKVKLESSSQALVNEIDNLTTLIAEKKIADDDDLSVLLSDIKNKIEQNEQIPSYMINALKAQAENSGELKSNILNLADQLKN